MFQSRSDTADRGREHGDGVVLRAELAIKQTTWTCELSKIQQKSEKRDLLLV